MGGTSTTDECGTCDNTLQIDLKESLNQMLLHNHHRRCQQKGFGLEK